MLHQLYCFCKKILKLFEDSGKDKRGITLKNILLAQITQRRIHIFFFLYRKNSLSIWSMLETGFTKRFWVSSKDDGKLSYSSDSPLMRRIPSQIIVCFCSLLVQQLPSFPGGGTILQIFVDKIINFFIPNIATKKFSLLRRAISKCFHKEQKKDRSVTKKQSYVSFANPKLHEAQQFSKFLSKSLVPTVNVHGGQKQFCCRDSSTNRRIWEPSGKDVRSPFHLYV